VTLADGPAPLVSRSVALRPLLPSDGEWCYALVCGPAGERWRYRGRTPPPDQVAAELWRGVFAQFVVIDRCTGRRAGLVGLYNVAVDAGRAYAFALAEPALAPLVTEGFGLLCQWAFDQLKFQRILLETPEFNLGQFGSLGDAAIVEGRLRNYEIWQGRLWDYFILALTAEAFGSTFGPLLDRRCEAGDAATDTLGEQQYAELVAELWPLDSLGLVEVLDALERVVDGVVDVGDITAIHAGSAEEWVDRTLAAARGRA
jgi:hypothetical protein